jgi:hypothetical protein
MAGSPAASEERAMSSPTQVPQAALKYDLEVQQDGRLDFVVPLAPGSRVAVFVVEEPDNAGDLLAAAESSLGFWDNPYDDEDWNRAPTG